MSQLFDPSRSLTFLEQDSTIIAVIEMSQAKWLVAAVVPGVERQPLKRLDADAAALLKLLHRWRNEASQAGRQIKRIVVASEAGRDGFWLARWLRVNGVEAYVIHPASIAVSREHRRAKTDRLDTELLLRLLQHHRRVAGDAFGKSRRQAGNIDGARVPVLVRQLRHHPERDGVGQHLARVPQ
jgi:transposase